MPSQYEHGPDFQTPNEAEIERLRAALEKIAAGTTDLMPPFRAMPRETMQIIARTALGYL